MSISSIRSVPRFIQTSKYGGSTASIPMDPKLEKFLECLLLFIHFMHMKRDRFYVGADFFEEKFKKECSEYMGMIPHLFRKLREKNRNGNVYVFPASGIESFTTEINNIIQMLFKNEIGKNLRFFPLFTTANQKKIIWLLFRVLSRLFLYYSNRSPKNGLTVRAQCYLLLFIYYRLLGRRITSITESTLHDKLQPGIPEIIHEYVEKSTSLEEETLLKIFIGQFLSGERFQPQLQKLPLQQKQKQMYDSEQQMYDSQQQMARLGWSRRVQQQPQRPSAGGGSQQQRRQLLRSGGGGGGGGGQQQRRQRVRTGGGGGGGGGGQLESIKEQEVEQGVPGQQKQQQTGVAKKMKKGD